MRIETERLNITEFNKEMAQVVHENSLDDDNRKFVPDEVVIHFGNHVSQFNGSIANSIVHLLRCKD